MGAKESFTGVLNALVPPTAVATAAATPPPPPPPPTAPEARRHRAGARFESKVSDMDMDVMMRVEGYEHKGWLAEGNNVIVRVLTTATRRIIMFTLSLDELPPSTLPTSTSSPAMPGAPPKLKKVYYSTNLVRYMCLY